MYTLSRRDNRNMRTYDPFREMEDLERFFFEPVRRDMGFRTDITEKEDSYCLQADLPGFKKDDIHVDVEDGRLTISAERCSENEDNNDGYLRRERYCGSYKRSFDISEIDADGISGDYTDGVLTLNLPKLAPKQPAARRIELT